MTKDQNKNITRIKYNHLNLPVEINFTYNRKINYIYDANGIKLQKKTTNGYNIITIDYMNGYQYENKFPRFGGRGYAKLLFFPTTEGYVRAVYKSDLTYTEPMLYDYVYNYTDHLGNIRVSYTKFKDFAKTIEETNYYPFGLKHGNYNNTKRKISLKQATNEKILIPTNVNGYKYKYNGKELQEEFGLNWYDYGARNYQADLGRWMNIDPLTEETESWTPYHYVSNNPMFYNDPTGMSQNAVTSLFVDKNNKVVEQRDDGDDTVYRVGDDWQVGGNKSEATAVGTYNYSHYYPIGSTAKSRGLFFFPERFQTGAIDFDNTIESFVIPFFGFIRYLKIGGFLFKITKVGSKYIVKVVGKGKFIVKTAKFDYFFGRVTSSGNTLRSAQNLKDLTTLGIKSEKQLLKIFIKAFNKNTSVRTTTKWGTTIIKSINIGTKGKVEVGFFYKGSNLSLPPSVSSIIPKIF